MSSRAPVGPEVLVLGARDGWSIAELCDALKRYVIRLTEVGSPDALRGVEAPEGPAVVVVDPERLTEFEGELRRFLASRPSILMVSLDRHLRHEVDLHPFRGEAVGFRAFRGARGRPAVELVTPADHKTEAPELAFRWLRDIGFNVLLLRGSDPGPVAARALAS